MIERYINPPDTLELVLQRLEPGDILVLDAGEHRVNLLLDKPCVLRGMGPSTLLQGSPGTGPVVRVSAQGVRLERLSLEHLGERGVVLEVDPGVRVQLEEVRNLAGRVKGTRSLEAVAPLPPLPRTLSGEQARPWPLETPEFPPKPEKSRVDGQDGVQPSRAPAREQVRAPARAQEQEQAQEQAQAQAQERSLIRRPEPDVPVPSGLFPPPRPLPQRLRRALWASAGMLLELAASGWRWLVHRLVGVPLAPRRPGWRSRVLAVAQEGGSFLRIRTPQALERRHPDGRVEQLVLSQLPQRPGLLALSRGGHWLAWLELEGSLHCVPTSQDDLAPAGSGRGWIQHPTQLGLALEVLEGRTPLVLLLTPEGLDAYDARQGQLCWREPLPIGAGGCLLLHPEGLWISNHAGRSWFLELPGETDA